MRFELNFQNYVWKQHALDYLIKDGEEDSNGRDNHKSTEKMISGIQHVKEFQIEESAPYGTICH